MVRAFTIFTVAFASLFHQPTTAGASELIWGGGYSWSIGEVSNDYVVDGVTLSFSINDLNSPGAIDPDPEPLGSPGSPQTNNYIDPTGNAGADSLFMKTPGNTSGVEVTLVFDTPVVGVNFQTFDVDATGSSGLGDYVDVVRSVATDGSTFFGPTSVTGNGSEVWALQGDGQTIIAFENADQSGGDSANGTALWSFDVPLTSITISYENADPTAGVQWIAISNISFSVVPEPSTGLLFGLGILGLAFRGRMVRAQQQ
jgi:hypothetical protein